MNANSIFHNKTTINITLFYMKKYFSRLKWPNGKKKKSRNTDSYTAPLQLVYIKCHY